MSEEKEISFKEAMEVIESKINSLRTSPTKRKLVGSINQLKEIVDKISAFDVGDMVIFEKDIKTWDYDNSDRDRWGHGTFLPKGHPAKIININPSMIEIEYKGRKKKLRNNPARMKKAGNMAKVLFG